MNFVDAVVDSQSHMEASLVGCAYSGYGCDAQTCQELVEQCPYAF